MAYFLSVRMVIYILQVFRAERLENKAINKVATVAAIS
jgi:hypothetical protein